MMKLAKTPWPTGGGTAAWPTGLGPPMENPSSGVGVSGARDLGGEFEEPLGRGYARGKRALDLLLVSLAAPVLAPLVIAIALWIKFVSRGPVLFVQPRVGLNGRVFSCLKFRSMHCDVDRERQHAKHMAALVRAGRPMVKLESRLPSALIPLGRLLRAAGVDELPQLINVLKGEMSLVGPRPCTTYELPLYENVASRARFSVLPGLTGLWQVSGKNKTTFDEMVDLDLAYARSKTLWLDLRILWNTPAVVLAQVSEPTAERPSEGPAEGSTMATMSRLAARTSTATWSAG